MATSQNGDIRISIDFDAEGTIKDVEKVNAAFKGFSESIKAAYTKADKEVAKLHDRHMKAQEAVIKQESELMALQAKYNAITAEGQQTQSMRALQAELKSAQSEYDKLIPKNEELLNKLAEIENQIKLDVAAYGRATPENQLKLTGLEQEFEENTRQLDVLYQKINKLKASLEEMKLNPQSTIEARKLANDIEYAKLKLERLKGEAQQSEYALQQAGMKGQNAGNIIKTAAQNTANTIKKESKKTESAIKGAGKGIGRTLTKIKQLILAAFIFNVISKGLRQLQEKLSAMLKTNKEYVKSLGEIKGNLKTAFYPIYQAILPALNSLMRALATATRYVAAFFAALSGKSLSETAKNAEELEKEADALKGVGKSAKNAAKGLAAFDEINQLSSGDKEDVKTIYPTDETEGGDTSKVEAFVGKLKGIFSKFTGWLKESFGDSVEKIIQNAGKLKNFLFLVFTDLNSKVLVPFGTTVKSTVLPLYTEFINEVISLSDRLYNSLYKIYTMLWSEAIGPALSLIMYIWDSVWKTIKEVWDEYGAPVFEELKKAVEKVEEVFTVLWETTLKPIWDEFLNRVKTLWDNHLQPLFKELLSFVAVFINFIAVLWNNILAPLIKWIVSVFGPHFATVFNAIQNVVTKVIGVVIDKITAIIKTLKNIITFITNVFKGDWNKAWDSLKKAVSDIGESIKKIFKSSINVVIGFINGLGAAFVSVINIVIRALNKLSFTVPDWVPGIGGKKWGFDLNEVPFKGIPELAKGAVIPPNNKFLAVLGDQKSGTNIEAPLATIEQALRNVLSEQRNTAPATYILELDGRQFGRLVVSEGNKEQKRIGTRLITV